MTQGQWNQPVCLFSMLKADLNHYSIGCQNVPVIARRNDLQSIDNLLLHIDSLKAIRFRRILLIQAPYLRRCTAAQ